MHIGLDFDNTIVSYDALFHQAALEKKAIPASIPVDRLAVRDYLRSVGREPVWTALQGDVYGLRLIEAAAYSYVSAFIQGMQAAGHTLSIISHKTKHPYLGPPYDLHEAAFAWIKHHLTVNGRALFNDDQIFFELTKEDKLHRIAASNCDVFIDDLPEILMADIFPKTTRRFLFDPKRNHLNTALPNINIISSWLEFENCLS